MVHDLLVEREQVVVALGEVEDLLRVLIAPGNQASLQGQLEEFTRPDVEITLALLEI